MRRVFSHLFGSVLIAGALVSSCDSQNEKSGRSDEARRMTMDYNGVAGGAGFSLVQPDLPPSEDDAVASEGTTASLALNGTSTDAGTGTSNDSSRPVFPKNRPGSEWNRRGDFIPPYFNNYVFNVTVSQNSVVVRETTGPYVPNRPLELRGLEPGKYNVKVDVLKGGEVKWTGSSEVEVALNQMVQARVSMHRGSQKGSEIVITPAVDDQKSCDYVPSIVDQRCQQGRFECTLPSVGSGSKAFKERDYCGEAFAKWRLLQKACDEGLKPTSEEISAISCGKIQLIRHPGQTN